MALLELLVCLALLATAESVCNMPIKLVNITDSTPVGTIIVPVLVTSPDALSVAETNSDPNNAGKPIQALANGSLILTAPIKASIVFRVICGSASDLLIVNMIDTDDNAPVWDKWNYTESVRETQVVPYELPVRPKADDPDKSSGQILEYKILPSEYSDYFSLNNPRQSVMNISLVRQLDYEKVQHVVLTLQVVDFNSTGQKVFEVNTTLTVNVLNDNDASPVWLNCTSGAPPGVCYVRQMLSNSTAGALVDPPVKAVDGNLGLNLAVFYAFVSQSPASILSINNATGALSLTTNLPVPQTYTIVMIATQTVNNDRKTIAELRLNIITASYSPPVFDQSVYNVTVFENNPPVQVVVIVKATDHLRRGVTYGLQSSQTAFTIDSTSGELKTAVSLNYESRSSYTFNVTASDGTGISLAAVTVMVGNVNEFNPAFVQAEYNFAVARRETGFVVGIVNATDGDGQAVTYSITDADFRKLFSVDPTAGIVRINTISENLPEQTYRFSVSATDGSRVITTTLIVSFDSALLGTANASVTTISLIVVGCIFAVIIIACIVAFLLHRRMAAAKSAAQGGAVDDGSDIPGSYAYGDLYDTGSTSQQENPVEGYNNFMFGDEDGNGLGSFNRERDQGELFVSNGYYMPASANDVSSLTNGSIHTVSGNGSLVGSQRTLVQGSRPRQLHAGSNLQVMQVENAVDASSDLPAGGRQDGRGGPGLTVYF